MWSRNLEIKRIGNKAVGKLEKKMSSYECQMSLKNELKNEWEGGE